MGLFGGTKTYVSSTIYNLAGDAKERSNFLKTLIAGHVITGGSNSFASVIQQGYIGGPGIRMRNYALWARDNYSVVGVPQGNLYAKFDLPTTELANFIPHDPAETVTIQRVDMGPADYSYWAEQWMLLHEPEQFETDWVSDYDEVTGEISIVLVDNTVIEFTPSDFQKDGTYVYALYSLVQGTETGPVVPGIVHTTNPDDGYPSTSGYTPVSSIVTPTTEVLGKVVKTTVSYSDGRPDEVTTVNSTTDETYTYYRGVFERTDYQGGTSNGLDQIYSIKRILNLFRDGYISETSSTVITKEELNNGTLIKTTKVETTQDILSVVWTWREDTQEIASRTQSPAKLFMYRLGSGNAELDAFLSQADQDGFYFPFIPLRLDNKFISTTYQPAAYDKIVTAYKKATSGKVDDIIQDLAENKSLKDIDYAYICFGISLNTKDNVGKKYLFRFFDKLRLTQEIGLSDYAAWQSEQNNFDNSNNSWINWREDQDNPGSPLFGAPMPNIGSSGSLPANIVNIKGTGPLPSNLDMRISWQSITLTTGTGQRKPGAKKGDFFVESGSTASFGSDGWSSGVKIALDKIRVEDVLMHWQVDDNNWQTLTIKGLKHRNYIYKGKYVEINGKEALQDTDESGFLVPLHYDTYKELSLVDSTQLANACCYLVLNSYLVKKTGFFQSGFFKILLVVAVVAIAVATGGIGGAGAGLLGTNAAVGTALGLSGMLGIIAGAVANMLVAMIVTKLIMVGATLVFGDKLGALIGTIASLVALQVGTAMSSGTSLAQSFSGLLKADNIIAMTSSVGNGVAGYMQAGAMETIQKTQELQEEYKKKSAELDRLYEANIGYDRAALDPLLKLRNEVIIIEEASAFLQRTLMTGSDVAEMSMTMLSNFTDITLSTDLRY